MKKFKGFPPGKTRMTEIPATFFSDLLPLIDDAAELKVTLFCFWALHQKEGDFRYLRCRDFTEDKTLMNGLAALDTKTQPEAILEAALARCVQRGTLLSTEVGLDSGAERLYFMNTARGQEAVRQLSKTDGWRPRDGEHPVEILPERPTIYRLYEENIGPLTRHIAEELQDAETEYTAAWVEDAIKTATELNKRNWRYIRGILKGWRKDGKVSAKQDTRGDTLDDGQRYITGKYSDFIKH
jgi:DnaD/phage-associated family protein